MILILHIYTILLFLGHSLVELMDGKHSKGDLSQVNLISARRIDRDKLGFKGKALTFGFAQDIYAEGCNGNFTPH